jgi:hypothetical protein
MRTGKDWLLPALIILISLALAPSSSAQVFTGRIDVTVADSTGALLPGAAVDITGPLNQTKVTDAEGAAHFLSLTAGTYQVKVTLSGFGEYLNKDVPVAAGVSIPLKVTLAVAGVAQEVQVTAESPVIDSKKTGTATTVSLEELQNVPSGRDPWVVMQTVPGIIVDRVNVGGSESGQQSGYQAKGAAGADATWNLDGVPITDMAATGSTPTYWDFDMFQEMNVTTGGSDMTSSTGGVHLSMVLKSGTNTPHGSARIYYENEGMQSNNMDPALATALGSPNGKGNRTDMYRDYGFELGGPILKDRLWAWGAIGRTDVHLLTIKQTPDKTQLKNYAAKAQGQVTNNVRGSFTYFYGDKTKLGRNASATRPPETTFDQHSLGNGFFKGEGNFVFGNNLFLTARVSHFATGFTFDPEGGMNTNMWQDAGGVWHGSFYNYYSNRPMSTAAVDGSYFKGHHELKYGFSWRKTEVHSLTQYPGDKTISYDNGYPNMIVEADADHPLDAVAKYISGWIGDTITTKRLTANIGVRFDHQTDSVQAMSSPAVAFGQFATWLPAISAPGVTDAIKWNSVSPRVSVSYALDERNKTLLRGSYAMFASQLGNGASGFVSALQYRYIAFDAVDLNGNHVADANEIDYNAMEYWVGFDINNPGSVSKSINSIGGYKVPKTHEIIVGLDHEIATNFGVSTAFTWRKMVDFTWEPRTGVRQADYVQTGTLSGSGLPDGSSYDVPFYAVDPTNLSEDALAGGREYVTHQGYYQRFYGLEVSATKRMANRWMGRFGFSTNKHQEFFTDRSQAIQDPTPGPSSSNGAGNGGPMVNGGLVVVASGGSGKSGIYQLLPLYQFTATGMYPAPYGIDLGVNLTNRQGFGQPWYRSNVKTSDFFGSNKSVLVTDVGQHRLPTVTSLDFRVGKEIKVQRTTFNIDVDIFNLFNSGTVLGRQYDLRRTGPTGFDQVLEIMNPRILRIGGRFNF